METDPEEAMFVKEMGFSLIVEYLMQAQKPIIGHNMIYDIIYLYNQFIGELPDTYAEFIQEWNKRFPHVYDTKVLSCLAEYFGRTDLGKVYEKCTTDRGMENNITINFDLKNGFVNYDQSSLLSHYHEAAYDAYMTGFSFINILKFKEIQADKFKNQPKDEKKPFTRGGEKNQKQDGGKEEEPISGS